MILAAGMGTRLLPLTTDLPKALISVNGTTLLEITIRKLLRAGFTEIIVNVHHHASKVVEFLQHNPFPGASISISDESEELLDTGGAILKARWFLDGKEPFLVHNVDIISNINLDALMDDHNKRGGLATISIRERQTKRYFLFDNTLKLVGWTDTSKDIVRWADEPVVDAKALAFSGIHVISPEIFNQIHETGRFSIVDTYLRLARSERIFGYLQEGLTWYDVGKPDQLEEVSAFLHDHPEFILKS
jgi:NDP-sugar pyrophosphorylase family protein